ncbi:cyclomaltodextrinase N-terminal domain-containing protein, partial [bacterium]|nr:cyclomaltodextrinase N-terminal domain-containing protein [bacterium]
MKFIQYILTCLVPFLLIASAEATPVVLKVEPPNWWTEHSWNPVRLLVHGRNFEGARVITSRDDVEVGLVRVNAQGTYLFVDLHIDDDAKAGPVHLKVITSSGEEEIPFELNHPLDRKGRFQGFSSDDVIYLLLPDRFANGDPKNDDPLGSQGLYDREKSRFYHGGDFQGIINKLPYLNELGVTAIWLNPIYDNNNQLNHRETYNNRAITDYHGYGAVDFYNVEEHFGDLDLYKELVDAAHKQGIKVIMDQVANHTGPYHPWVNDPPTPTWFNGTEQEHLANTWQTWTLNDPYATDQTQKETLEGWFINILPDLNQNDEETAFYLIQNSLWWIGVSGIDAIRQDTLPYVPRRYWSEWADAVKREYPGFVLLGEMFDGDPAKVAFYQGGVPRFDGIDSGISSLFDFPLYYKIRDAFAKKQSVRDLAVAMSKDW